MKDKTTVMAVVNQKGGTAKTTTVENLGIGLARCGKKVLLVDVDPQASLTICLGYPKPDDLERTLADMLASLIVATHMMLEAASLDLGSVWISYFDQDKAREMLKLPENWKPVCMLYIGYPADDFVPNTSLGGHRKPLSETCFYNELSARI